MAASAPAKASPSRLAGGPDPQMPQLEIEKLVARKLIETMDESSLWHLARILQHRGLIRSSTNGFEAVTSASTDAHLPKQSSPPGAVPTGPAVVGKQMPPAEAPPASAVGAPPSAPAAPHPAAGFNDWSPKQATVPDGAPAGGQQADHASSGPRCSDSADENENGRVEDRTATTLILRNLPWYFDQKATQEWVDGQGYEGQYDFLLWFPAKKTSRLNTSSYAFVNFREAAGARHFRLENHLSRFPAYDDEQDRKQQCPLSIAVAKVQGFTENYIRFHHLTSERSPTLCHPFFAQDSTDKLSQEAREAAAAVATSAPPPDSLPEGAFTTLIIRNLPYSVDSPTGAREWLDNAGFQGQYDFFLYLPAKRRRPEAASQGGPPQGLGYAFVNFRDTDSAQKCAEALNGRALAEGDPVLSVVAARVQGLPECLGHFGSLGEGGRIVPWVDPSTKRGSPVRQYQ